MEIEYEHLKLKVTRNEAVSLHNILKEAAITNIKLGRIDENISYVFPLLETICPFVGATWTEIQSELSFVKKNPDMF